MEVQESKSSKVYETNKVNSDGGTTKIITEVTKVKTTTKETVETPSRFKVEIKSERISNKSKGDSNSNRREY